MVIPFVPYVPLRLGQLVFDYVARNYWPGELKRRVVESGFTIVCTDYLWQTFENISGSQPVLVTRLRPILRRVFGALERPPGVRMFGVSQVVMAARCLRPVLPVIEGPEGWRCPGGDSRNVAGWVAGRRDGAGPHQAVGQVAE